MCIIGFGVCCVYFLVRSDTLVTAVVWGGYDLEAPYKYRFSFAEYSLFYRALLQKRPVFLGSLLSVAKSYLTFFESWTLVLSLLCVCVK